MTESDRYDVIIVGTGAGGGTLLRRLAPSGLRILVLERGGAIPREPANWDPRAVFGAGRYKAHETWHNGRGRAFEPGIHYAVGGNTKVYGAALMRLRERDFEETAHPEGTSPAWPIRYGDLEPWYAEAEALYHVHGQRGADPTEPPASGPYPHPPVSHEPRIRELARQLEAVGLRPFPLPMGVMLDEADPAASRCVRCATCDGFPCLVWAKADAEVIGVRPALRHPGVTLLTGTKVLRLETGGSGREVTGVVAERDGAVERFLGDVVVLACGAVNTAALLLRSRDDRHPHGLANASGVVGRHYMCHHNTALLAVTDRPNTTIFQKTLGINDWYFGTGEFPHPMGHVQMLGKSSAAILASDAPRLVPARVLEHVAANALDFWITSEDLPDPENRVALRDDGTISLAYRENNPEGHRRVVRLLKRALRAAGLRKFGGLGPLFLSKKIGIAGTAHQCGTVRFGSDRRTSALDADCRAHDVENLYVADGSFFVSSGAVNPGLTIMANALRVGDRILERLGRSQGTTARPAAVAEAVQ